MRSKEYNLLLKLFKVCENREFVEVGNWILNSQTAIMNDKLSDEEISDLKSMIAVNKKTNKTYQKLNKKPVFIENSKFNNTCSICSEKINSGDPIFINGKQVWHPLCANDDDKKDTKYLKWSRRFEGKTEDQMLLAEQEYEDNIIN